MLHRDSKRISVEGHMGTYCVIDETLWDDQTVFLLENENYGQDVPGLIVREDGFLLLSGVFNGFDELADL
ncbi:hypothetical protein [Paenibacillus sp. MMO-58]|uniref:hypothetical protein n=1 Tax=Paenibacillus sp. MMO-58 TaxID=3081290 RepID=UPI00301A2E34